MRPSRLVPAPFLLSLLAFLSACAASPRPGDELARRGDEILACGRLFHTGAPVVLYCDPGGYDAYRVERRFGPRDQAAWDPARVQPGHTPNRYSSRRAEAEFGRAVAPVGESDWTLEYLRQRIDQLVIHYDVAGTSRACFRTLHDDRNLSVHFMLDLDGTIYQTLDLKERARHATIVNDRSIGIEIANIGAYPVPSGAASDALPEPPAQLNRVYLREPDGRVRISLSDDEAASLRVAGFVPRPSRPGPIVGVVQGETLAMYDLTDAQYESLARLTAALCRIFPEIQRDYPRDGRGELVRAKLPDDRLVRYRGLLGHYHVQSNKTDPGPAFDWDRLLRRAGEFLP
ncbi:MAG: N-acetylmuramoyl-L-alanine amidase [Phycisphaerae bacterium]|nr:N-acetylmuramoyl-L-alanine amidase [Phycisphaerae bacterium]